mgnify:CR=1 FL=1
MSDNYATITAEYRLRYEREHDLKEQFKERLHFAKECEINFFVSRDIARYWLPKLVAAQTSEHAPVSVTNRGESGSWRSSSYIYTKALQTLLGPAYEVRVRFTRLLLRPYIQVSWAPQSGN